MRINYDTDSWKAAIYADHYFEDHSQMFLLDYNGYGEGADWNKKVKRRFFMYSLKDIMLGFELNLKYSRWLKMWCWSISIPNIRVVRTVMTVHRVSQTI